MDRNELTVAIAGALVAAFLLGWLTRWAFARLNTAGPRNAARTADLAARLHAASMSSRRSSTAPAPRWRGPKPRPRRSAPPTAAPCPSAAPDPASPTTSPRNPLTKLS